ncbi:MULTISPECIES: hypothetical protein [Planococcus]|uniref:Uncharacterized protein n=2 Tax=Planococcus TaxID=1372 RepID=A0ABM5WW50_9BACL|nr:MULTISPECIES: hypothetical protein [Planococcus]ALS78566.1 hypothetical protein AUO94_07780 [Planococcus kocurii]AQU79451.1 hypothetical protein AJGP001_09345 [Planococcus faecalis]KAA0956441.1 hypothetical protein FQ085_13130 [Planococcus sp. ANT_H30]MDJ0332529.1 hypothetical protein [Planococcus sp. S3-L1]OHX51419.1 hypothetical protein BB777_03930 [Planococcus faecalis]
MNLTVNGVVLSQKRSALIVRELIRESVAEHAKDVEEYLKDYQVEDLGSSIILRPPSIEGIQISLFKSS